MSAPSDDAVSSNAGSPNEASTTATSRDAAPPSSARVVVVTHASSAGHVTPNGHPECVARMDAVHAALVDPCLAGAVERIEARAAKDSELACAHDLAHVEQMRDHIEAGNSRLDPDTYTSIGSWSAATHAAGAGLTAISHLESNPHLQGAFVAARPPGHHATAAVAMGFCLLNNVAVAAAHLAERGERVLIVDWDVHHGNGTQAIFWNDPRVSFVSLHEANNYPFSGRLHERGGHDALGATTNLALPSHATGDVYRAALDHVVEPIAESLEPTWVLVSAGFDAHHRDPLSDMALTAGDFGSFTRRLRRLAPATARTILFLEGGYDLEGLRRSITSSVAGLADLEIDEEVPSSDGPGMTEVAEVREALTSAA